MAECPGMIEERLKIFLEGNTLELLHQLGFGIHGKAFAVKNGLQRSAVKVFDDEAPFERELACYKRLLSESVTDIEGFAVPILMAHDEDLKIIRMSLVSRPFCLDFASAYLDELPPYFPPFDESWHEEKENQFGAEHWPRILAVARELESLGIYQTDVSPSNIAL